MGTVEIHTLHDDISISNYITGHIQCLFSSLLMQTLLYKKFYKKTMSIFFFIDRIVVFFLI
ncbi:MAG: hypothetical protein VR69_03560 [Peptococcaceae bacterium BRH_c4b]|nr:MAG: hypothetical protein VR69_03560 [Peptococcaceae bacterium BRH_c4b]